MVKPDSKRTTIINIPHADLSCSSDSSSTTRVSVHSALDDYALYNRTSVAGTPQQTRSGTNDTFVRAMSSRASTARLKPFAFLKWFSQPSPHSWINLATIRHYFLLANHTKTLDAPAPA